MLRNTLKGLVKDPELLKEDYFTKRPEQLSVEDFVDLTLKIQATQDSQDAITDGETS